MALAKGEIVSSTCFTASSNSPEDVFIPLVWLDVGVVNFLTGILFIEADLLLESIKEPLKLVFMIGVLVAGALEFLALLGLLEDESGESRTNVPSLLGLCVQSCSTKYDLVNSFINRVDDRVNYLDIANIYLNMDQLYISSNIS